MGVYDYFDLESDSVRNTMSSQHIVEEFFDTFHPVEVEETLREFLKVILNPRITTTDEEKEDFAYFLQRLTELVKAVHSSNT